MPIGYVGPNGQWVSGVNPAGSALVPVRLDPTTGALVGPSASWSLALAGALNTIALLGDSITDRNAPAPSGGYSVYGSDGYFSVANALMGWQFEVLGTSGSSGQDSGFILGRLPLDILSISPKPRYCFVLAGTNDEASGLSVAQTRANLTQIYTTLQSNGITPIIATLPPRNDAGWTLARKRRDVQRNRWIREFTRVNDVICCDFYRVLVNSAAAGTAGWTLVSDSIGAISDTSVDQIHPNNFGSFMMALEIVRRLGGLLNLQTRGGLPAITDNMYTVASGPIAEGNIVPNGSFTGTAGTKGAIATGSLADEWSRQGDSAPAGGGTIVLSKVLKSDSFGYWQQIAIAGGTAGDNQGSYQIRSDQDYPSVFSQVGPTTWQVGDTVWGQVAFETDAAGWAGAAADTNCNMAMRVQFLSATGSITETGWGLNAAGSSKHRMPSGVLRTRTVVVPPGTTAIYMWIYVVGRGTWRFADAEIRKQIT